MLSNVTLNRPIIFFDLETTGTNISQDRIVELCTVKIFPDGQRETITQKFNPTIPIPKEASDVHGITDEEVKDMPKFADKAKELQTYFSGCDLGGYNIASFDMPLLAEEFLRARLLPPFNKDTKLVDAMKIFHAHEKRDLTAAYRFYCNKALEGAHSAEADVTASVEVLNQQVQKYGLQNTVGDLHAFSSTGTEIIDYAGKFSRNEQGVIVLTFGKNAGKAAIDDKGYLEWMLKQDFPLHTKYIISQIMKGQLK